MIVNAFSTLREFFAEVSINSTPIDLANSYNMMLTKRDESEVEVDSYQSLVEGDDSLGD